MYLLFFTKFPELFSEYCDVISKSKTLASRQVIKQTQSRIYKARDLRPFTNFAQKQCS